MKGMRHRWPSRGQGVEKSLEDATQILGEILWYMASLPWNLSGNNTGYKPLH